MKRNDHYLRFDLVHEMLETPAIVSELDVSRILESANTVTGKTVLLTGEGSSRIFPAKNIIATSRMHRFAQDIFTEGATQALDYSLADATVFVASNSGRTKEGVRLIRKLRGAGHQSIYAVAAHDGTPIMTESDHSYLLTCGPEKATAATKSVVEQALFYDILFRSMNGTPQPQLSDLSAAIEETLLMPVESDILVKLTHAPTIYFAGRNNGVAEELTLKTNEITRKRSDFLEGTYAVHGIEEVMREDDVIVLIDPFESEEAKFKEVLVDGVGLTVVAISDRQTSFPTIRVPSTGEWSPYVQLVAGWNLLVETGLALGVMLDTPTRARKIGNELIGG